MSTEQAALRAQVCSVVRAIPGLSALVGTRVFYAWPEQAPVLPMVTFGLSQKPVGDYPFKTWDGRLSIEVHATTVAGVDAVADLIADYFAAQAMCAELSKAALVIVQNVNLEDIPTDDYVVDEQSGRLMFLTRTLVYVVTFVAAQANQP